jgi:hypothetical protein
MQRTIINEHNLIPGEVYYDTMGALGSPMKFIEKKGGHLYFDPLGNLGNYPLNDGLLDFLSDPEDDWYLPLETELNK